ncbi:ferric uptake regulator, Fur family [Desulfofarcimen acetoxidans DSM 771]|jgi:Fur family peroxide stress response transcriptional regulator|uniref:Ferric uptake regulator, Fur family n=1 Tax=Desulfofarcimen acetoxidans (strain ATCC 49208 / DSM 771 / KCTC 5769 / VKM B-1644 / 5575) TaxID=485916 RepID=C8VVW0_DESAS|nr:Fur family transcriptional regulator [Desulfofarcimen acetoxidans]ACV64247.1 ferric uptake regulator, Fur family [Desulfofarcimen acetoxidans DSM 771]
MESILKGLGLRATPQRLAILKLLEGNITHPSAEELYNSIKPNFPSLSLTTVYNTLESLSGAGVIQEIGIDSERRRFDPNPKPHNHFLCNKCRKVFDLNVYLLSFSLPQQVGEFWVEGAAVHFFGLCSKCVSD